MAIPDSWALMFFRHPEMFATKSSGESWLSIGTLDYAVTQDIEKKLGFSGSCAALFKKLGYTNYVQLDINAQTDIVWDLNKPIKDHHNEFDFVYDGGSIEHTMNPVQSCINLLTITKVGGRICHSQGVGDNMGHGYRTFNPEFVRDFYTANGCEMKGMFLMEVKGNEYQLEKRINPLPGLLGYLSINALIHFSANIITSTFRRGYDASAFNYSFIAVVEKKREAESILMPMQVIYAHESVLSD